MILASVNVAPLTVLHGLKISDIFKQQLLARFPLLAADIHSFSSNPNCSCKNNIMKAVRENYDAFAAFIKQFVKDNPSIDLAKGIGINTQEIAPKNIAGEIYTINKDEFKKFYTDVLVGQRCIYRSCSVVPEGDSLKLFFL